MDDPELVEIVDRPWLSFGTPALVHVVDLIDACWLGPRGTTLQNKTTARS
jgi:hypothetical protein